MSLLRTPAGSGLVIVAVILACLYGLHRLDYHDELQPINLTAGDCRNVQC